MGDSSNGFLVGKKLNCILKDEGTEIISRFRSLMIFKMDAPGGTRTLNLSVRSALLYPFELLGLKDDYSIIVGK
jgi:hypothetical protein